MGNNVFVIFNKRKDFIKWVKIYGIFIILVYSQIFLAFATHELILIAFYPITFLSVQCLENGVKKLITYFDRAKLKSKNNVIREGFSDFEGL